MSETYYGVDDLEDYPRIVFHDEKLTLKQISQKFTFPKILQSDLGYVQEKKLDLSQPLFAYCLRSVNKVSARSVKWDTDEQTKYQLVGLELLIPEDYTGFFSVLGSPNENIKKNSSRPYRSVYDLNKSNSSAFLVAGITPIKAYLRTLTQGVYKYTERQLLPGDVISKGNDHILKEGSAALQALHSQHEECRGYSYAVFRDEKDRDVLVRTEQRGVFYPIYQDGLGTLEEGKTLAMKLVDIIFLMKTPVMVKLLHGWVPAVPCDFTGTLLLHNVAKENTVVASTFLRDVVMSLEIPLESNSVFKVAQESQDLMSSRQWTNAMRHCRANAQYTTKGMKVIGPEGSVDIDESLLDDIFSPTSGNRISELSLTEVKKQTTETEGESSHDNVQLRHPRSTSHGNILNRLSSVNCLSKRVGVYALDFSYNTRELTVRRLNRQRAFREGKIGGKLSDSTSRSNSSENNAGDSPSANAELKTRLSPLTLSSQNELRPSAHRNNFSANQSHTDNSGQCPDVLKLNELNISDSNLRKYLPKLDPLYSTCSDNDASSGKYDEIDEVNPLRRTGSKTFHMIQNEDQIVTISPRAFCQEQGAVECEDDYAIHRFLFHGSAQSHDDYITPLPNPYGTDGPRDAGAPFSSLNVATLSAKVPPQPPKRGPPLANKCTGCFNRDMLIGKLKEAMPITPTEELALKSLSLAEFTTLLWRPAEAIESYLMALIPKVGKLDLKNIVLYFETIRHQVKIITDY